MSTDGVGGPNGIPLALKELTRRKCFISYHHDDEVEVQDFIQTFDHDQDVLIARGIGASMSGDIINSNSADYIMQRIREKYLRDTSVTIVMTGICTWARQYVDWEVAASLRNTAAYNRNGLMAIALPSVADSYRRLPQRVADNVDGDHGYARWWTFPQTTQSLADMIEAANDARTQRASVVDNSRSLRSSNAHCP